jgi:hypothetical protein
MLHFNIKFLAAPGKRLDILDQPVIFEMFFKGLGLKCSLCPQAATFFLSLPSFIYKMNVF